MALTSSFRRRRTQASQQAASKTSLPTSAASSKRFSERGLPFLWPWAADANRSRLRSITLAHVLSGDTVSPISLSDFEAFLAFCDISLENLQFIVWFQDFRSRFESLSSDQKAHIPSPRVSDNYPQDGLLDAALLHPNASAITFRSSESSYVPNLKSRRSEGAGAEHDIKLKYANPRSFYGSEDLPPGSLTDSSGGTTHNQSFQLPSNMYPLSFDKPNTQPFRNEVQNIIATFFVPSAKKELSLSSKMRERVIKESSQTTHPDVFFPVYEAIYETIECVSLPRFMENASTNINRPRQLFWYFSALPTFLLGVAIALLFILSPSHRFTIPPQSHRAWRLFSVPCFLLSSMMWYKGFRGFCPLLFLRSSRQLRLWELENMADDHEAQAFCLSVAKAPAVKAENEDDVPLTPISPNSTMSPITRIAPFLDNMDADTVQEENGTDADMLSISPSRATSRHTPEERSNMNEQFRSRAHNRFHRPPIFGPGRVVEDVRIRAVHKHLLWSLIRFGLFWAAISAAIVVSLPSLH